jgi:predicted glycosyltransferase
MNPTVLFHPQNHVGLGHVSRLSAIALALRRMDASLRTPFVVEGAAHALLDALGLPYVPLPSSHTMFETGDWDRWDSDARQHLCLGISRAIISDLAPQIVVFDSIPNQAFLSAVLEARVPIVLCLRQVNDIDRYLRRLAGFLPSVRLILVPHDEGTFRLPAALDDKSLFVGEIVRPASTAVASRPDPGCPGVVIHGGGGGHPGTVDFFNAAIQALVLLRRTRADLNARLITGPLFSDWLRLKVAPDLAVVPFDPELTATLAAADLVICQAGYNTIAELKRIATRVLVVPMERRWDDQFSRADQAAAASGRFRVFRGLNPHEMARAAGEFLQMPVPELKVSVAEGARRAAESIALLFGGSLPGAEP